MAPDRSARRPGRRDVCRRFLQPGRHPQRHARPRSQPGQRRRAPGSRPLLRPHLEDRSQAGEEARGARIWRRRTSRRVGQGDRASEPRGADECVPPAARSTRIRCRRARDSGRGEQEQYAAIDGEKLRLSTLLKLALDPRQAAEPRIAALWILGRAPPM